eukprot:1418747-Pyramimonas_sp.AAC.2
MSNPVQYYDNITANTVHVVKAMQRAGVHRLIYSSTCATYGNPAVLPITELTPTLPINPYGKAKLAAEQVRRQIDRLRGCRGGPGGGAQGMD